MELASQGIPVLHFLYIPPILFAVAMIIIVCVSLSTAPPPAEKYEGLTWTPRLFHEETAELIGMPWYQNYRVLSVVLLISMAIFVYAFR